MLLAIDVGNSNTTLGVYNNNQLVKAWRIQTQARRTSDEYGLLIHDLLDMADLKFGDLDGIAISNVVPPTVLALNEFCTKYLNIEPFVVDSAVEIDVKIRYEPKTDVGADRIVNAIAAYQMYGGPAIVVDMGTATTFDAISSDGEYLGGAIAPGIGISVEALFTAAAKLPRVELIRPPSAIGTTTKTSMQSGIIFGFAGQVDAIVERFVAELGDTPKVIATGGLAELIAPESKTISIVNPLLMLDGLRIMYDRNSERNKKTIDKNRLR